MSKTTQICLASYDDDQPTRECELGRKYLFDLGEQLCVSSRMACKDPKIYPQGWFSDCRIGLYWRDKLQIAMFSIGDALRMSVQCKIYDASYPAFIVKRKNLFLGANEVIIMKGNEIIRLFRYWASWDDITDYCERVTRSAENKKIHLSILNRIAQGRAITDQEMEKIIADAKGIH